MDYKYFTQKEIEGLNDELCAMLDDAREMAEIPFVLTETVRKPGDTKGSPNSAHYRGLAADIRCHDSRSRFAMVVSLVAAGFRRTGVYDRHIHVDIDESLPQDVMWMGKSL